MTRGEIVLLCKTRKGDAKINLDINIDGYPFGLKDGIIRRLIEAYNSTHKDYIYDDIIKQVSSTLISNSFNKKINFFTITPSILNNGNFPSYTYKMILNEIMFAPYLSKKRHKDTKEPIIKVSSRQYSESRRMSEFVSILELAEKFSWIISKSYIDLNEDSMCSDCIVRASCMEKTDINLFRKRSDITCDNFNRYKEKKKYELLEQLPEWSHWMLWRLIL